MDITGLSPDFLSSQLELVVAQLNALKTAIQVHGTFKADQVKIGSSQSLERPIQEPESQPKAATLETPKKEAVQPETERNEEQKGFSGQKDSQTSFPVMEASKTAQLKGSGPIDMISQIEKQLGGHKASFDRNIVRMIERKNEKISSEVKNITGDVFRIVFSGGPCAGKTTAITKLVELLRERNFIVFVVPEAATLIGMSGGQLNLEKYTDDMKIKFQFFLMMIQMSLEDCLLGIARSHSPDKNIVMLCDRGTMDGLAYMGKKLWERMINEYDLNTQKLRDNRYDLAIHISTAANGAEEFYSLANNSARHEALEFARWIDRNLEEAWIDHPHFVQINNSFASFEAKIDSVINTVYKYLGLETGLNFYNKYLIADPHEKLLEILRVSLGIKTHTYKITDILFFKDETKQELTYFRKRVS